MRPQTHNVTGPRFVAPCRKCGVRLANYAEGVVNGPLFSTRPMLANPNDPPFTYICPPCDSRLEMSK